MTTIKQEYKPEISDCDIEEIKYNVVPSSVPALAMDTEFEQVFVKEEFDIDIVAVDPEEMGFSYEGPSGSSFTTMKDINESKRVEIISEVSTISSDITNSSENDGTLLSHKKEQNIECSDFNDIASSSSLSDKMYQQSEIQKDEYKNATQYLYPCEICNKAYTLKSNLKRHQRSHTEVRPYSCDLCDKTFMQPRHLQEHQRVHTGEKPFTCKICNKSFQRNGHLKMHQRVHTGECPYKCLLCDEAFAQFSTWKVHQLTHTEKKAG